MFSSVSINQTHLLPGLFKERADLCRNYLMELSSENLLQNHLLESNYRFDKEITKFHLGWEAPTCQLRGHFLGHWMSAASMFIGQNNDRELKAKLDNIIDTLSECQERNGGEWIGSIPEKYFKVLETDAYIWSPQYTLHKTVLGLYHSNLYAGNKKALNILSNLANWYIKWTDEMLERYPRAIYRGEEGGMLEVWAGLYELTKDEKYLTLAERYNHPSIFQCLENGEDPLTNSHSNASIPWAHGAAKMYQITNDTKWLNLVKLFWECAVTNREAFCTGGQNAGEYWIAPGKLSSHMGDRTQEFCTVYNMVRLADYLFRFTGESKYTDYIERNLYNGFLAQQNQFTGMPAYFLPMRAGGVKKWGSKTNDFWCCHGTMVQSQSIYPMLAWYEDNENNRVILGQYISSEYRRSDNTTITQSVDMKYYNDGTLFDNDDNSQMSRWYMKIKVLAKTPEKFTLSLRIPGWVKENPIININKTAVDTNDLDNSMNIKDGFLNLERTWSDDEVCIYLPAKLTFETVPDNPKLTAFLEGPIVLAGLTSKDAGIHMKKDAPESALIYKAEHTYTTFPWMQSHYQSIDQPENIEFIPLYEVTDEPYTLYFTQKKPLEE